MLTGLTKYYRNITRFNTNGEEKIGCIVMNCNPFTIGHEYIIKHAISLVDYLYIFIVEEDSSMFTFEERLYMVRKSFSMYRNIKIIPSGPLIISAVTFPEYFVKDKLPQNTHAAFDVFFFRRLIVPLFAISVRFVGKEPFCKVTQEYNEQMKKQLPEDGVAVVEIDRLEMEGQAISASHVRRLIQAGDTARLKQLLPPVSYDLVSQRYLIVRSL